MKKRYLQTGNYTLLSILVLFLLLLGDNIAGNCSDMHEISNTRSTETRLAVNVAGKPTPPAEISVVSINRLDPSPTNASTVHFEVTFSGSVTGLNATNFQISAVGAAGAIVATVTGAGTSWTVTTSQVSGNGTVRLDMINSNDLSSTVSGLPFTGQVYTIDNTAPDTWILTSPASLTNSTSATFSFSSNETSVTYQVKLDDGNFTPGTSPKTYTGLSDGPHTFQVRAVDEAGNIDQIPASYTWNIDTTPPSAPVVINPANGSKTTNNKPTVRGTAEANVFITILIDGTLVGTVTANPGGKWMFPLSNALPDAMHDVKATASDAAGNTSLYSNTNSFTIAATPVVTDFAPAGGAVCDGTPVTLTATVGNVTESYAYTLTNGSNPLSGTSAATTFSQTLNGVSPGNYTYTLTVSSNGLSATATAQVTVDSQPSVNGILAGGVLGNGTCSVDLSSSGIGSSFIVTGPNGFVYSTVYRQAGAHTVTVPGVTTPGTYTLLVSIGACSATVQVVVSGTACR